MSYLSNLHAQIRLFAVASLSLALISSAFGEEMPSESIDRMIVFDASGSMWGQIEGEPKISIARRVMNELLADLPDQGKLGLTAYGHRVKGDCGDIETLVSPAPLGQTRKVINDAISGINPKGKTPLSAAVIEAARSLRHTENAATVILISDGKETCDMDPCAVATQLERDGVNFTTHVIGFDVAKPEDAAQLQCLADNTGGQYFSASNAQELAKALEEVSALAPIEPSEDDFAEMPTEPAKAYFEDGFEGDALKSHWRMIEPSNELFSVRDDALIAVAPAEIQGFWREKALNRFVLDHPLPDGDFDMKLDFRVLVQSRTDEVVVGLYDEKGSMVYASLFFETNGCGTEPILFVTSAKGKDGGERSEFRLRLIDATKFELYCAPGATEPADIIASFAKKNATLVLQKRGRDYAARIDMEWPAYRDKPAKAISVATKPLKLLRAPGKASFMASQRDVANGESILIADRFSIMEVK